MPDAVLMALRRPRAVTLIAAAALAGAALWSWPLRYRAGAPAAAQTPDAGDDAHAPHDEPRCALQQSAANALAADPARALSLIERADAHHGRDDEERRVLEIEALVGLGRVGQARALTRRFYERYPQSAAIADLERLTGYHPRPTGPGTRARRAGR